MHELSIALKIYEIVEENIVLHNLNKVDLIVIKVGRINGIYEKSLRVAFKAISKGTKCEQAKIVIETVEGFELLVERIEGEGDEG